MTQKQIKVIKSIYDLMENYDKTGPEWLESITTACLKGKYADESVPWDDSYAEDIVRFADWLFVKQVELIMLQLVFEGKLEITFGPKKRQPTYKSTRLLT